MTEPLKKIDYPIDKLNSNVWEDLAKLPHNNNGQIEFATEKRGSGEEATVLFGIDFDGLDQLEGLKLLKKLTPFDKRVFVVAGNLMRMFNGYTTAGLIYRAMGNKGDPPEKERAKINASLTKMRHIDIYINNTGETGTNKKTPLFNGSGVYDGSLLPFDRVSGYVNNGYTDDIIRLLLTKEEIESGTPFEPPLMRFARERKQITTIPQELFAAFPLNKNETNLRLEDYLIERIARMKNGTSTTSHKMLYETIYKKCLIDGKTDKDRKARKRTPDKIKKCLKAYKDKGIIKDFTEKSDGIEVVP